MEETTKCPVCGNDPCTCSKPETVETPEEVIATEEPKTE